MECKQISIWVHIGDRVDLLPGTKVWAEGYRSGTVTEITDNYIYVLLDGINQIIKFRDIFVRPIIEGK